jgi:hypothetical protein
MERGYGRMRIGRNPAAEYGYKVVATDELAGFNGTK